MQQQSLSHLNYVPGAVAIGAMLKNRFPLQSRLLMLYCLEKAARGKTNDFLVDKEKRDSCKVCKIKTGWLPSCNNLATQCCKVLYSLLIRCIESQIYLNYALWCLSIYKYSQLVKMIT